MRQYNLTVPVGGDRISKATILTLLQNAVHGISELRIVKEQGDQLNVHSNQALTYAQCVPLVKSAA